MSLETCDVTGSTDRVEYLPLYMQTDKVKKVCFGVALKMEDARLNPKGKELVITGDGLGDSLPEFSQEVKTAKAVKTKKNAKGKGKNENNL